MSYIKLQIITPLGVTFEGEVLEVYVPTKSGNITVLPNHIPLISILKSGELLVRKSKDSETSFAVHGGVIEVRRAKHSMSEVIVLTDRSELSSEIDAQRAQVAYDRAKELLQGTHVDNVDFARFESLMDKELNRVHLGKKYK